MKLEGFKRYESQPLETGAHVLVTLRLEAPALVRLPRGVKPLGSRRKYSSSTSRAWHPHRRPSSAPHHALH
jgi:hypothetical protein